MLINKHRVQSFHFVLLLWNKGHATVNSGSRSFSFELSSVEQLNLL